MTPSYITCAISPSLACGRLWQWSIQIPGLSATNATVHSSPSRTLSESVRHGLPVERTPSRDSTVTWWPCRCIGWTWPLTLEISMTATSPSSTRNIGTSG